jgi:ribonuclease P protein component
MTEYSFPKEGRLCSLNVISKIFREGKSLYCPHFKILYIYNSTLESRVVISVPKRNIKQAVNRNRVKRLTREVLRQLRVSKYFSEGLDLFFIYTQKNIPNYSTIDKSIRDALTKIEKTINKSDNNTTNTDS